MHDCEHVLISLIFHAAYAEDFVVHQIRNNVLRDFSDAVVDAYRGRSSLTRIATLTTATAVEQMLLSHGTGRPSDCPSVYKLGTVPSQPSSGPRYGALCILSSYLRKVRMMYVGAQLEMDIHIAFAPRQYHSQAHLNPAVFATHHRL